MLKTIVFAISEAQLHTEADNLARLLEEENQFRILFKNDCEEDSPESWSKEVMEHGLLISDSRTVLLAAKRRGMAVIGCVLSEGQVDEMSGIPYLCIGLQDTDAAYLTRVYEREHRIAHVVAKTDELCIREISLSDLDALYTLCETGIQEEYMPRMFDNKEEEAEYLKKYIEVAYALSDYGDYVITLHQAVIGRISLHTTAGMEGLELGYIIHANYRRKGYATKACRAILEMVATRGEYESCYAYISPQNMPAIALAKKLGFVQNPLKKTADGKYLYFMLKIG